MKILLVDDSRSAAAVFAMRLGEIGHEVVAAENGAIAVEKFRTEAPDLVLMDIEMPVMNGFEATNRIRQVELSQRWAWTPIVFLTSVDTPENFVTSIDAGGDDLIPKNVPEPVLRAKLKAMARVAGLRRELIAANRQMEDDIRARKAAESELSCRLVELTELNQTLSNMQAQLIQTEKLASIGQLAAGVAHEINTPIGFVRSNLGTLADYIDTLRDALGRYEELAASGILPEQMQQLRRTLDIDYIEEDAPALIRESCDGIDRISRIVQNLRDFSQLDSPQEWQEVDLHQGLEATLNLMAGELQQKAEIVRDYGPQPPIECRPRQLNQVFMSLLSNAIQAIDAPPGRIVIRTGARDDAVWVEISDNGCGIAEDIRARIFDPFFTTRPVGQGAGLGLALSYGIVQSHDGRIEMESETGGGTCFRLLLPMRRTGTTHAKLGYACAIKTQVRARETNDR